MDLISKFGRDEIMKKQRWEMLVLLLKQNQILSTEACWYDVRLWNNQRKLSSEFNWTCIILSIESIIYNKESVHFRLQRTQIQVVAHMMPDFQLWVQKKTLQILKIVWDGRIQTRYVKDLSRISSKRYTTLWWLQIRKLQTILYRRYD